MGEHRYFPKPFLNISPFISALMVVGIHSYNAGQINGVTATTLIEGFFSHGLFCAAVPLFFLMSGYLFFLNVRNIKDIIGKWKKRVRTVLIPFLAWSVFYYVFYAFGNYVLKIPMDNEPSLNLLQMIKGIFLYEYCFPLWYMFQLMIYILLAPLVFCFIKCLRQKAWSLVILCYVASLLGFSNLGSIGGVLNRSFIQINFLGYWIAGGIIANGGLDFVSIEKIKKLSVPIVGLLLILFSLVSSLMFDGVIQVSYTRLLVPFIAILYVIILIKLSQNKNIEKYAGGGIPTMIIYGVHPFVGQIWGQVLNVLSKDRLPLLFNYVIGFIAVSVVSTTIAIIMKRWLKPLYVVFGGNR